MHQLKALTIKLLLTFTILSPSCVLGGVEIVYIEDKENGEATSTENNKNILNNSNKIEKSEKIEKKKDVGTTISKKGSDDDSLTLTDGEKADFKNGKPYKTPERKISIDKATIFNFLTITNATVEVTNLLIIICNDKLQINEINVTGSGQFINHGYLRIEALIASIPYSLKIDDNAKFINKEKGIVRFKNSGKPKPVEKSNTNPNNNILNDNNALGVNSNEDPVKQPSGNFLKIELGVVGSFAKLLGSDPVSSLVLEPDQARIVNDGEISAADTDASMAIETPTYIGEKGIIKVKPVKAINIGYHTPHCNKDDNYFACKTFPIYAITRISDKLISQDIKGLLGKGGLGEHAAKKYYKQFEDLSKNDIISGNDNSGHGIDVICIKEDELPSNTTVIFHECKCYSLKNDEKSGASNNGKKKKEKKGKSFALDTTAAQKLPNYMQMDWGWIMMQIVGSKTSKIKGIEKYLTELNFIDFKKLNNGLRNWDEAYDQLSNRTDMCVYGQKIKQESQQVRIYNKVKTVLGQEVILLANELETLKNEMKGCQGNKKKSTKSKIEIEIGEKNQELEEKKKTFGAKLKKINETLSKNQHILRLGSSVYYIHEQDSVNQRPTYHLQRVLLIDDNAKLQETGDEEFSFKKVLDGSIKRKSKKKT